MGHEGLEGLASFWLQKSIFFALFLKFQFFIDFKAFWEGLERILEGFGKDFGKVWGGFARIWESLGRVGGEFGEEPLAKTRDGRRIARSAPPPHRRWRRVLDSKSKSWPNLSSPTCQAPRSRPRCPDNPLSISPPGLAHSAGPAQNR